MTEKPVYLTREGQAKLEAELQELVTLGRLDVAERIKAAKELGDISESGEYEDAKNSQALLEGRIRELKSILSRAQLISEDNLNHREVDLGSSVTIQFEDEEEETWVLVGSTEARPHEGKISNESPIGSAILGKKPGQKVTVQTPSGVATVTVIRIN
jgi:transcription elongation factor GreA